MYAQRSLIEWKTRGKLITPPTQLSKMLCRAYLKFNYYNDSVEMWICWHGIVDLIEETSKIYMQHYPKMGMHMDERG